MIEPTLPDDPIDAGPNLNTGIGGNNPPEPMPYDEDVFDTLKKKTDDFLAVSNQWVKIEITTETLAEQIADQIAGLRKVHKSVEDARKSAKEPYIKKGKEVDAAFNALKGLIEASAKTLKPRLEAYITKRAAEDEAKRQEAIAKAKQAEDDARRKAFDAAQSERIEDQVDAEKAEKAAAKQAKAAAKPVSVAVKSASGGGRTISQRKRKVCEITNIRALFLHMQEAPEVRDVLQRLANAEANTAGFTLDDKIPGVKITETTSIA